MSAKDSSGFGDQVTLVVRDKNGNVKDVRMSGVPALTNKQVKNMLVDIMIRQKIIDNLHKSEKDSQI